MAKSEEIIYLFRFSARETKQLSHLLPIIKGQIQQQIKITIILLHDGIIGTSKLGQMPREMEELLDLNLKVKALTPDIIARGLDPINIDKRVQCIEYAELVDHLVEIPKIVSWM